VAFADKLIVVRNATKDITVVTSLRVACVDDDKSVNLLDPRLELLSTEIVVAF